MLWSAVEAMATVITAFVAIGAAWYAARQWRDARAAHVSQMRPYIVPVYTVKKNDSGYRGVWLDVTNYGQTPARSITLDFDLAATWKSVEHRRFPFLNDGGPGISIIPPGATLSYFVGPYDKTSALSHLRDDFVAVTARYVADDRILVKEIAEEYRLTLRDYGGTGLTKFEPPVRKQTAS